MVVAAAYSLIAIFLFNQADLFWGGAASLTLLITGLTGAYRFLPDHAALGDGLWHDMGVSAATALVMIAALGVVMWPLR